MRAKACGRAGTNTAPCTWARLPTDKRVGLGPRGQGFQHADVGFVAVFADLIRRASQFGRVEVLENAQAGDVAFTVMWGGGTNKHDNKRFSVHTRDKSRKQVDWKRT